MPIPLVVNGVTYQYPQKGNQSWGPAATAWANAVTTGMLQKAGGSFTLTNEVDFGANYGLKSIVFKSRSSNIADAGIVRMNNSDLVTWRNGANDGNNTLGVNSSNVLLYNGSPVISSTFITAVSDTSTIDLTVSSETLSAIIVADSITNALINASAAIAYSKLNLSNSIVNADINLAAAIAVSKLASGTSAQFLLNNSTPTPTWTTMSGDISLDNTGATTTVAMRGKTLDGSLASVGATQDGYVLTWENSSTSWKPKPQTGSGGGVTTIGTINSQTKSADGGVISSDVLYFQTADASFPGLMSTGTQTITGQKTFNSTFNFAATNVRWTSSVSSPTLFQIDETTNSVNGNNLTIQAQNSTGTSTTGGTLDLTSGTGTTAAGAVRLRTGGTTRLIANATGIITIPNLSTGLVHADSSGNLTSSLLVNADITTGTIALTKLATQSAHTFVANNTGSTASPVAITGTQATAELDTFTSSLKGLVPSSGGGTTNFLRADGTWAAPGGGMTNPMTTTGDMIYSSSGSTPARLAIGSTDAALQVAGGIPTWSVDRNMAGTVGFSNIITPTALSGDVNNYNPTGLNTCNVIRIDGGAANRIITGLTAPSGSNLNRVIFLVNIGATNSIFLSPENGSSTAANRFTGAFTVELEHGMCALIWYDTTSSRWKTIAYS